jgi:hypothetical protein
MVQINCLIGYLLTLIVFAITAVMSLFKDNIAIYEKEVYCHNVIPRV